MSSERSYLGKVCVWPLLGLLCAVGPGCGAKKPAPTWKNEVCEYRSTLDRWTKVQKLYDRFTTRFYITTTWRSDAFRRCYVHELNARKHLLRDDFEALVTRETAEGNSYHDFVLALYTPEEQHNDLTREGSIWNIVLEVGGERRRPVALTRLHKTPELELMYPYLDRWHTFYLARYERKPSDAGVTLEVAGLTHATRLTWAAAEE